MTTLFGEPERGPRCIGCQQVPDQIREYIAASEEEGMSPNEFVRSEEGTYNPLNGHFTCTSCFERMGSPSSPMGWIAP